ncbi:MULTISPECIES: hypothetical protein [unclassified Siphonobacter]|uniref:hypothetical protein n=1 Tax=unclassified Siphonobacter TaxID=2635712 RepID=UPI000CA940C0|nr:MULTISPECIES: hypothetical protein [unclassified Siphonobacter]MDR6193404.1 hypothetical protein [Siphonobacter sp. SORGH_AS_0500]PKK34732.1 hypothetical protein BWI96_20705 [Siphonobacter sp. SORGH_AS_0500]
MHQYTPSDSLINLLFENGFREVTEQYFPHSHVRLELKGEAYHPAYFQRAFRHGTGTALIILNYLTIRVLYRTYVLVESRRLAEDEAQAIVTFCKLPAKQQGILAGKISNLSELMAAVDPAKKIEAPVSKSFYAIKS